MARRRAQASNASDYAARDVSDDFSARDTGDELEPIISDSPSGDDEPVEPSDGDTVPIAKTTAPTNGEPLRRAAGVNSRLQALPPVTRAIFVYLARLARSLTEGATAPESRPIPPEQRARGVVLVVQVLPDGRRVVFR
jgi:hypothetical protein